MKFVHDPKFLRQIMAGGMAIVAAVEDHLTCRVTPDVVSEWEFQRLGQWSGELRANIPSPALSNTCRGAARYARWSQAERKLKLV
jgi:hypothetical protein